MSQDEQRIRELEGELAELRADAVGTNLLLGLGAALAEVKSVEETIDFAVKLVPDTLGGDRCFAAVWNPGTRRFVLAAHSGYEEEAALRLAELAAEDRLPLASVALKAGKVALIEDVVAEGVESPETAAEQEIGAAITIPLLRWGEDVGALCVTFPEPKTFTNADLGIARAIARQIAIALANARRFALLGELREVGVRVSSQLRLAAVTRAIGAGAIRLLGARAAGVYFAEPSGHVLSYSGSPTDAPGLDQVGDRIDVRHPPWSSLAAGEIVAMPGPDLNVIAAPVCSTDGALLGTIVVLLDRPLPLGAEEEEAVSVLCVQAAAATETARRFEQQRRVATTLQKGLLEHELPPVDGFEVGWLHEAAGEDIEAGGDFYDAFHIGDQSYAIVVGDVSGKGTETVARMARAKNMLRAFALRNPSPKSVMFHLNNALVDAWPEERFADERFATLCYALCEPLERRVTMSLAGHPEPLLLRSTSKEATKIEPRGGILGAFKDMQFEYGIFTMNPGDVLLLYTDGLIEARSGDELYGLERVAASLQRHAGTPASDLVRAVHADALEFGTIADDTIVFALVCRG